MADQVGRFALTAIGGYFFGPWGALAGSFLANFLFPVEGQKGPRLNELNLQHSTIGAAIPIVYGTGVLAGNVIFSGGLTETEHEGGGGKGGPSGPATYSYAVDVAVGICEGPIGGIRRIWADADLIYDASDDTTLAERFGDDFENISEAFLAIRAMSAQLDFDLYLGDEDQLPDPTIESHVGVGLTPAYRGLAYIVLPNFQLEKFGNRIPNFRFEVFTLGTNTECAVYSAGHLEPWQFYYNAGTLDPRNPSNQHLYGYTELGGSPNTTYEAALADINAVTDHPENPFHFEKAPQHGPTYVHGWAITQSGGGGLTNPCGIEESDPFSGDPGTDYIGVFMSVNSLETVSDECESALGNPSGFTETCAAWWTLLGGKGRVKYVIDKTGGSSGYWVLTDHNEDPAPWFEGTTNASGDVYHVIGQTIPCADLGGGSFDVWRMASHEIEVRRWWAPTSSLFEWTRVSGTFKSLRPYVENSGVVTSYPKDPTLRSDDVNYDNEDYWTAAYNAAVADNASLGINDRNRIPEDWVYGVDYPTASSSHISNIQSGIVWAGSCTTVTTECIPMAEIVSDICRRDGLRTDTSSQIDVSDLSTCVPGYIVGQQMSGRDALGPLRMYGLFDAVESDAVLRFVERGHAPVATLTTDDLGAHEHGSEPPSLVEVARTQEKDLPRRVRLHFPNFLHDHEVSEQSASRITTEAIDELDVQLPVSMEPDTAKQLVEIMLSEAWVARNGYRFSLDNDWLGLEPTDCVGLPVDGNLERVRIVAIDYKIGGLLQVDAMRDDDGTYVSTAVAVPGQPSGGVPGSSGGGPICDSAVVLLDIPCLTGTPPSGDEAWIYAAIYGTCANFWNSAALYRSDDGGETYAQIARAEQETTVGTILDMTGPDTDPTLPGDSPPYDSSNSITVNLLEGTLASVSDAGIDAGLNLAAIGQPGRWVIIQFKTADLDTNNVWTLTDLIWGVNGTEHLLGTTGENDTFVLLSDSALLRIPVPASAIGVQKHYKVVSAGQSIDAVDEITFTTWGLCYQRFCPSTVISATLTDPPASPVDGDSYLLPNDTGLTGSWAAHGGEIATWSSETGSWVFCMPVPGSIIHISDGEDTSGGGTDVISGGDGSYTPSPWAQTSATFVTVHDESATLPNSFRLVEGTVVDFEFDTSANTLTINAGGIPQNLQNGSYTILAADNGRHLYHPSGAAAGHTYTLNIDGADIGAGFAVTIFNLSANPLSIAVTGGTLRWIGSGAGATGTRSMAQYGHCTIVVTDTGDEALVDGALLT